MLSPVANPRMFINLQCYFSVFVDSLPMYVI